MRSHFQFKCGRLDNVNASSPSSLSPPNLNITPTINKNGSLPFGIRLNQFFCKSSLRLLVLFLKFLAQISVRALSAPPPIFSTSKSRISIDFIGSPMEGRRGGVSCLFCPLPPWRRLRVSESVSQESVEGSGGCLTSRMALDSQKSVE